MAHSTKVKDRKSANSQIVAREMRFSSSMIDSAMAALSAGKERCPSLLAYNARKPSKISRYTAATRQILPPRQHDELHGPSCKKVWPGHHNRLWNNNAYHKCCGI